MLRALTGTPVNNVMIMLAALTFVACDVNPENADRLDDEVEIWGFDDDDEGEWQWDGAAIEAMDLEHASPPDSPIGGETGEFVDADAVCEQPDAEPDANGMVEGCVDSGPMCSLDREGG